MNSSKIFDKINGFQNGINVIEIEIINKIKYSLI